MIFCLLSSVFLAFIQLFFSVFLKTFYFTNANIVSFCKILSHLLDFSAIFLYDNTMKNYSLELKINGKQNITPLPCENTFTLNDILFIYYNRYAPRFRFQGEKHNFYEFFYVMEGNMIASIDNEQCNLSAGDFIVVSPMRFHSMYPNNTYAASVAIAFDATGYEPTTFGMGMKLSPFCRDLLSLILNIYAKNYREADFALKMNSTQNEKDFAYGQMLKSSVELLLVSLLQDYKQSKLSVSKQEKEKSAQAQKIMHYLETHYTENPSLATIAAALNYSVPHLCRIFKAAYNESIGNYMIQLKVNEAMKLIEKGEKQLGEISDILGFDSISYFSKVFKKYTDMTPSAYKKFASWAHLLNAKYIAPPPQDTNDLT